MGRAKAELRPQARALYAQGMDCEKVAGALGVGVSSIYRWQKQDGEAGCSWDAGRADFRVQDLRGVIAILHRRLATIAADEKTAAGPWADRLVKVVSALEYMEGKTGNVNMKLEVCDEIGTFCSSAGLSDDDLAVMRRVFDAYLTDLKARNL